MSDQRPEVLRKDLNGEVAVVTGAGRGFGRVVAERLAKAGAAVSLFARTQEEIKQVATGIQRRGGRALALGLDVTDRGAVELAFDLIDQELGPTSILVNNAGTLDALGPTWEIDPDSWWREVEIHLRGTLLCSDTALKRMVPKSTGRIINVGGMLGQAGEPYSTAYTCAKTAIYRLSECLASELADHGVRVFCMSPGAVHTGMTRRLAETEDGRRWQPEFAALGERDWISPDTGAELVCRLAMGHADALSGRALHVSYDFDRLIADPDAVLIADRLAMRITP
jgi:NAD(P)-dependent dehydrogenase (short-subunit alcohol dehydrogenase family)